MTPLTSFLDLRDDYYRRFVSREEVGVWRTRHVNFVDSGCQRYQTLKLFRDSGYAYLNVAGRKFQQKCNKIGYTYLHASRFAHHDLPGLLSFHRRL